MSRRADRMQRKAARDRRALNKRIVPDFLPPEGVPLRFEVAGLGVRFAAQLLDLVLTALFTGALILLLGTFGAPWNLLSILWSLLFFLIRAPYYILTEILWNGQTLGKRLTGIRVISADGRSLRPYAVTVRNFMKEVEVFYPGALILGAGGGGLLETAILLIWIAILLAVPLTNRKRQRMGDMIANTYVIRQPAAILLPDVAQSVRVEADPLFPFLPHQLDHYGAFELQTLERVLQVDSSGFDAEALYRHNTNLSAIAKRIVEKIDYSQRVPHDQTRAFLQAFYIAQRQYLESRKLFGDSREDKFHREEEDATKPDGADDSPGLTRS